MLPCHTVYGSTLLSDCELDAHEQHVLDEACQIVQPANPNDLRSRISVACFAHDAILGENCGNGEIYVSRGTLTSLEKTVQRLLHELAHDEVRGSSCEDPYAQALEETAARALVTLWRASPA